MALPPAKVWLCAWARFICLLIDVALLEDIKPLHMQPLEIRGGRTRQGVRPSSQLDGRPPPPMRPGPQGTPPL
eukprot:11858272-Heterocapsa_arctica.AAC.1